MNRISFTPVAVDSYITCEEYFPVRVVFSPSAGENRFIYYSNSRNNLLEFTVDSKSNLIKQFQVVICSNYTIIDHDCEIPASAGFGSICLMNDRQNNCDTFIMSVYSNCIQIALSSDMPSNYYAMGQMLFGINKCNELVSLFITNLSTGEIEHAISELKQN